MQNGYSPFRLYNTHRDINDIPPPTVSQFSTSSEADDEPMIIDDESAPQSIASNVGDPLQLIYTPNNPLVRTIFRPAENNNEQSSTTRPVYNENVTNDQNLLSEAAGYDPTRTTGIDADEAYALQLQQEEYAKESLMADQHHPYFRFRVQEEDESPGANSNPVAENNDRQYLTDEQFAQYLQERESGFYPRPYRRQQPPSFVPRQRPQPQPQPQPNVSQEANEPEIQFIPPVFRLPHQGLNSDDDSDDNNPYMNLPHPFIHFLAHNGQFLPNNFPPFFPGYRSRGHRRTGNLQDNEDDFGPEDYERLLQLDDTIRKKKLTKDQINSIKEEKFVSRPNQSNEEHKCSVCLEHFEHNQSLRRFPCDHIYHKECGDRWLQENNVCPICREPPVNQQSSTHSRHHRTTNHARRPIQNNNRSSNNRNNNNHNNNNNNHHATHNSFNRRGPAPPRQS